MNQNVYSKCYVDMSIGKKEYKKQNFETGKCFNFFEYNRGVWFVWYLKCHAIYTRFEYHWWFRLYVRSVFFFLRFASKLWFECENSQYYSDVVHRCLNAGRVNLSLYVFSAIKYFKNAIAEKEDVEILCLLSKCYRNLDNLKSAMEYLHRARKIKPVSSRMYEYTGDLYFKNEEYIKSLYYYNKGFHMSSTPSLNLTRKRLLVFFTFAI